MAPLEYVSSFLAESSECSMEHFNYWLIRATKSWIWNGALQRIHNPCWVEAYVFVGKDLKKRMTRQ